MAEQIALMLADGPELIDVAVAEKEFENLSTKTELTETEKARHAALVAALGTFPGTRVDVDLTGPV